MIIYTYQATHVLFTNLHRTKITKYSFYKLECQKEKQSKMENSYLLEEYSIVSVEYNLRNISLWNYKKSTAQHT